MGDVGAADVEGPGDRIGLGRTAASAFFSAIAACSRAILSRASSPASSTGWSVTAPSGGAGRSVQMWSIGLPETGDQRRLGGAADLVEAADLGRRHQPRVVADAVAGLQPCLQPLRRRRLDQMLEREGGLASTSAAGLDRVAAVDEDRRFVGQHDRRAGRAGESGEPGEALRRGRQVLALVLVGMGHDEAGEPDAFQFRAELRQSVARRGLLPRMVRGAKTALPGDGRRQRRQKHCIQARVMPSICALHYDDSCTAKNTGLTCSLGVLPSAAASAYVLWRREARAIGIGKDRPWLRQGHSATAEAVQPRRWG